MAKLLFAGDVVIQDEISKLVDDSLLSQIKEHDVVSCNFEAPIHTASQPITKIGPNLSQSPLALKSLLESGFTMLNLANNHILDYGQSGLKATIEASAGFDTTGAGATFKEAYQLTVKTFGNTRFGFLGLAEWGFGASTKESEGGFAWINHESVNTLITEAKKEVAVLIVQVHAGVEEIDIPLPEWRARYRELITLGADVIVGHHTHTTQGYEEYQGGIIFYSLGNFLFQKDNPSPTWTTGLLLSLEYEESVLQGWKFIPINAKNLPIIIDESERTAQMIATSQSKLTTNYEANVDTVVLQLWKERYLHFFTSSLGGYTTLRGLVRSLINFLSRQTIDYTLLTHNLRIESHRFVATRAATLLTKKDHD